MSIVNTLDAKWKNVLHNGNQFDSINKWYRSFCLTDWIYKENHTHIITSYMLICCIFFYILVWAYSAAEHNQHIITHEKFYEQRNKKWIIISLSLFRFFFYFLFCFFFYSRTLFNSHFSLSFCVFFSGWCEWNMSTVEFWPAPFNDEN